MVFTTHLRLHPVTTLLIVDDSTDAVVGDGGRH